MIRAMRSAATGMIAQQFNVDTIANNLANVNTTGFKKNQVEFQDLLYQTIRAAGTTFVQGAEVPSELQVGNGVRVAATPKMFTQGDVSPTNRDLDIALNGDGFFQIMAPDGNVYYTRDGAFELNADGTIVTKDGYILQPEMAIPENATELTIGADGTVSILTADAAEETVLGQIELARFINPAGLKNLGRNLYTITAASGDPILGMPGQDGMAETLQKYLEKSNVQIVDEMVNMITAQRAYEINSKAITTSDDMLSIANNLKR
ncbi:MAG: flagellar basal-body rod protein FlgG [Candidatus Delongbacteria bacterium]|nr:flagellar basal-body rod protein FlgG [Candidatus Delongbacteria bacterium]